MLSITFPPLILNFELLCLSVWYGLQCWFCSLIRMVRAWYMDEDTSNPQLEHHLDPAEYVPIEDVFELSGVEYFKLNLETYKTDGVLDGIRKERKYSYEDEITCSETCIPNYADKLKIFFEEHLHTDEEIRLVLDGAGYFDVRDKGDRWIRIEVGPGDMLILPSGIFHRFTPDKRMYVKAKRYFIGEPVWVAHNRIGSPAEGMDCRKEYLKKAQEGF
ncbi:PREDICTED: 1,2-dihydroxy-3-keto-5-methylthiopentene dioxygenase [Nicrophorus vespilloides]|uniref:Acireductone dioxygenase n=1 Tax=Nicrophorus vespilloides TaxID=110193 RepID=A0ABM1N6Y2_NICVS|nr:PREDICTED: 1,2-dihydroxy-3-keto-5-methylthiopentene dioxygenase [Nicrophorus vespilloides]